MVWWDGEGRRKKGGGLDGWMDRDGMGLWEHWDSGSGTTLGCSTSTRPWTVEYNCTLPRQLKEKEAGPGGIYLTLLRLMVMRDGWIGMGYGFGIDMGFDLEDTTVEIGQLMRGNR